MFKALVMAAWFATTAWSVAAQRGAASAPAPSRSDMGGDRFIAGSSVTLTDAVAGDLFAAGGSAESDASVGGDAVLAGGRVFIDGPVGGDVQAASGQVELGPNARIAGTLRYRSGDTSRQDPAPQMRGGAVQMIDAPGAAHAGRVQPDFNDVVGAPRHEPAARLRASGVRAVRGAAPA